MIGGAGDGNRSRMIVLASRTRETTEDADTSQLRYHIGMVHANILQRVTIVIGRVLGFWASSADSTNANHKSDNAARGGEFNFRTEMFDDGTDSFGWYEDD